MAHSSTSKSSSFDATNSTLLNQARSNQGPAWEKLVELYAPLIYSRCRGRWNLKPADAENVGQEVFRSVAEALGDFRRQRLGSFRAWLRVIVDNKCLDHFRKASVAAAQGGTQARELMESVQDPYAETSGEAEAEAARGEKAILMGQAMKMVEGEFSHRDWEIFWAVAVDDRDRSDTAKEFGVSDNVVYLAISRIRKRLRIVFEDLLDDDLYPQ